MVDFKSLKEAARGIATTTEKITPSKEGLPGPPNTGTLATPRDTVARARPEAPAATAPPRATRFASVAPNRAGEVPARDASPLDLVALTMDALARGPKIFLGTEEVFGQQEITAREIVSRQDMATQASGVGNLLLDMLEASTRV